MRRALPCATLLLAGCGGSSTPAPTVPQRPTGTPVIQLTSSDVDASGALARAATCDGAGRSPAVRFAGVPAAARELRLVVTDPDAPGGTFTHWNLPIDPAVRSIPAGAGEDSGWKAVCPPAGDPPHHYRFQLTAYGAGRRVLAIGVLEATYGR